MLFLIPDHLINVHDGTLLGGKNMPLWEYADKYTVEQVIQAMSEDQLAELEEAADSFVYTGTNAHGNSMNYCEICEETVYGSDPKSHMILEHIDVIIDRCTKCTVDENSGTLMIVDPMSDILYMLFPNGKYEEKAPGDYEWTTISLVIDSTLRGLEKHIAAEFDRLVDKAATFVTGDVLHVLSAEVLINPSETIR